MMRSTWTDLTVRDTEHVILGLLRDEQYELALEKLEDVIRGDRNAVASWILDIFILVFSRKGFVDEVLRLLNYRLQPTYPQIHLNILHQVLDICSSTYH